MPFVSSIVSGLTRNEIEEKANENIENFRINFDFFKNIDLIKINNLLIIIKILVFLEIGFCLSFLIYSFIDYPLMFFAYFFQYLIIGLILFPNTIRSAIDSILRGNVENFYIIKLYIIGLLILFFIEINPTYLNYLIGLVTYGFILNFSKIYRLR